MRLRAARWAMLLAALGGVFGCSKPPAAVPPAAAAAAKGPDVSKAKPSQRADQEVAEALALVGLVRNLPVRGKVPGYLLAREELKQEIANTLRDETPPELVIGNTELLFALDVVAEDFDLNDAISKLYGAQLAGFYDPDKKRMVLASDLGEDEQALTLYHELVHALQDQHYDLAEALDWKPELSDSLTALQALAEGDATVAMLDVARARTGMSETDFPVSLLRLDGLLMQSKPEFATVPGFLIRSMISPYVDGVEFVRALRAGGGGWAAVDAAWRDRPISTEQILHLDKYLRREPVVPVPAIPPPPGFATVTFRDVMGEQGLRLVFEEWAPARTAATGATGWGGDRIAVFSSGRERVVRWHLAFDDEASAKRAHTVFARGALRPELVAVSAGARPSTDAGVAQQAAESGRLCVPRRQRGPFAIVRHGSQLGVTLGPYQRVRKPDASADRCPVALAWADALVRQ